MRHLLGWLLILAGCLLFVFVLQIGFFVQECFYGECANADRAVFALILAAVPTSLVAGAMLVRTK